MKSLLFLWFLFIAPASFWLAAYNGEIDGEEVTFLPTVYAVIAILAAVTVRAQAVAARGTHLRATRRRPAGCSRRRGVAESAYALAAHE